EAGPLLIPREILAAGSTPAHYPELRNREWERTRPACRRRRLAYAFVSLTLPPFSKGIICGTKFSAGRRKPHASGVRSPMRRTSFGFNCRILVNETALNRRQRRGSQKLTSRDPFRDAARRPTSDAC